MKIAVVVLNYKTPEDTIRCIRSIKETSHNVGSIYLVDNCSGDSSCEVFEKEYSGDNQIQIIVANDNKGYSCGNNLGLKKAHSDGYEYVMLINPDVVVKQNAIDLMLEELKNNDSVGVVGPKVLAGDGSIAKYCKQGITFKYYLLSRKPFKYFDFHKYAMKYHQAYNESENYIFDGMVSGCCFMVKLKILQQVDFFDENLFLYYEEDVLWSKMHKLGYLSEIVSEANVIHYHSASIGGTTSTFSRMWEEVSAIYYLKNYRNLCGIKLLFAIFYSKMFFLLANFKQGKGFERYKLLVEHLKKVRTGDGKYRD